MTWRCPSGAKSASSRPGWGRAAPGRHRPASVCCEEVSSGMNSMAAPSRSRTSPAEATVTCSNSGGATSAVVEAVALQVEPGDVVHRLHPLLRSGADPPGAAQVEHHLVRRRLDAPGVEQPVERGGGIGRRLAARAGPAGLAFRMRVDHQRSACRRAGRTGRWRIGWRRSAPADARPAAPAGRARSPGHRAVTSLTVKNCRSWVITAAGWPALRLAHHHRPWDRRSAAAATSPRSPARRGLDRS